MNENTILKSVPAAGALRKVPGFDPLKHLRTTTSHKTGEKVLKLDLPFKKLWFRLACPNGRMLLKPLRITDQMAIFEAKVFLSKDDPTPISNFTSTQMAKDVPGGLYIRAAQDEALNEALDNAGFGIQLCDVIQVSDGSQYGSEIPLAQVEAARQATQQNQTAAVDAATIQTVEAETPAQPAAANNASVQMAAPIVSEMPAAEPLVTEEVAATEPVAAESAEPMADPAPMEQEPVGAQAAVAETVDPAPTADGQTGAVIIELPQPDTNEAPAAPIMETDTFEAAEVVEDAAAPTAYTADMSVEDICERMTLDDARSVVVSQSPAAIRRLPAPLRSTTSMTTPVSRICIWIPAITIRSARQATTSRWKPTTSPHGRRLMIPIIAVPAPSARSPAKPQTTPKPPTTTGSGW